MPFLDRFKSKEPAAARPETADLDSPIVQELLRTADVERLAELARRQTEGKERGFSIHALLYLLDHPDTTVRARAERALATLLTEEEFAQQSLAGVLFRKTHLARLERTPGLKAQIVDLLMAQASSPTLTRRPWVAVHLGALKDPRAIPTLRGLQEDADDVVRQRASEALTTLDAAHRPAPAPTHVVLPAPVNDAAPGAPSPSAASHPPTDVEEDAEWEEMSAAIAPFDKAYLALHDDEVERLVRSALDGISAKGERGIAFLLEKLYEDLRFDGTTLHHPAWGDDAWNIWLKKRELVRAIARSGMRGATLHLERFLDADSNDAQFHSILRPALAEALKQLEPGAVGAPTPPSKPKGPRCAVCDRDLAGAPAMRDNLTGAYYCDDHGDRIGR